MECRFCRKKSPNNNIFDLELKIFNIIKDLLKISKKDDLPKLICKTCLTKLKTIEKFIRQCEESDTYFRNNITLPVKQEPEILASDYETKEETKEELSEMELKYASFYKQFEIKNSDVTKVEKTADDIKNLDCIVKIKEEIIDNGIDADDYIAEDTGNDIVVTENKVASPPKRRTCNCPIPHKTKEKTKKKRLKKPFTYFTCSLCPAKYNHQRLLDSHVTVHDLDTVFTCTTCQIVFRDKHRLRGHILTNHKDEAQKIKFVEKIASEIKNCKESSDSLLCPICGKCFSDSRSLNGHLSTHSTEKLFQCDICATRFPTKYRIKIHMSKHMTARSYACEQCSKTYKSKSELKKHVRRIHLNPEPKLPCHICTKTLSSKDALKRHITIHTGEKSLQCTICYKTFRGRTSLTKHLTIHSEERPFTCSYCPKTFKSIDYIKEHERLHTGERPFKCPVCLRGYAQRCNMKSHFKYNHRDLDYHQEMERYKTLLKQLPT